jgi:hypothetical protein
VKYSKNNLLELTLFYNYVILLVNQIKKGKLLIEDILTFCMGPNNAMSEMVNKNFDDWLLKEKLKKECSWLETDDQEELIKRFAKHLAVKLIRDSGKVWFFCEVCHTKKFGSKQSKFCTNKCAQKASRANKANNDKTDVEAIQQ